jgi:hypothetical protein
MSKQLMVDLETFGTKPNSVIIAIGACKFNSTGISDTFYEVVDPSSCVERGMVMDVDTVLWWMKQSSEARDSVCQKGDNIHDVLIRFTDWCQPEIREIWGNGSDFDNVLLRGAYMACGLEAPWKYSNNRCFRTMKKMFQGLEPTREGTHHNALDDAKHQAYWLANIQNKHNIQHCACGRVIDNDPAYGACSKCLPF